MPENNEATPKQKETPSTWGKAEALIKKYGIITASIAVLGSIWGGFVLAKNKVDSYINQKASAKITEYRRHDKKVQDSLINVFYNEMNLRLQDARRNEFKIDQTIEALIGEFDKYDHEGVIIYKSNPNSIGFSEMWCLVKESEKKMIYRVHYSPNKDAFTYYDRKHKYHILNKKDIYNHDHE